MAPGWTHVNRVAWGRSTGQWRDRVWTVAALPDIGLGQAVGL